MRRHAGGDEEGEGGRPRPVRGRDLRSEALGVISDEQESVERDEAAEDAGGEGQGPPRRRARCANGHVGCNQAKNETKKGQRSARGRGLSRSAPRGRGLSRARGRGLSRSKTNGKAAALQKPTTRRCSVPATKPASSTTPKACKFPPHTHGKQVLPMILDTSTSSVATVSKVVDLVRSQLGNQAVLQAFVTLTAPLISFLVKCEKLI